MSSRAAVLAACVALLASTCHAAVLAPSRADSISMRSPQMESESPSASFAVSAPQQMRMVRACSVGERPLVIDPADVELWLSSPSIAGSSWLAELPADLQAELTRVAPQLDSVAVMCVPVQQEAEAAQLGQHIALMKAQGIDVDAIADEQMLMQVMGEDDSNQDSDVDTDFRTLQEGERLVGREPGGRMGGRGRAPGGRYLGGRMPARGRLGRGRLVDRREGRGRVAHREGIMSDRARIIGERGGRLSDRGGMSDRLGGGRRGAMGERGGDMMDRRDSRPVGIGRREMESRNGGVVDDMERFSGAGYGADFGADFGVASIFDEELIDEGGLDF